MESVEKNISTEKRKYPRINVDFPIKYGRTNLILRYGRAANVSEGGLLVYLPEEMEIGQHLALKLFSPSRSEFDIFETFVKVVWKDIHLRNNWTWDYRTGVKFVDTSPKHMDKLKSFLVNTKGKPPNTA